MLLLCSETGYPPCFKVSSHGFRRRTSPLGRIGSTKFPLNSKHLKWGLFASLPRTSTQNGSTSKRGLLANAGTELGFASTLSIYPCRKFRGHSHSSNAQRLRMTIHSVYFSHSTRRWGRRRFRRRRFVGALRSGGRVLRYGLVRLSPSKVALRLQVDRWRRKWMRPSPSLES